MSHNRLAAEQSLYLRQHADNPVHWQPWDATALAAAEASARPILLSIGYASCHWCHVMERESFADAAVAARMNRDFVCIKVDREERPDLDSVYMAATQALNEGRGGWPMTLFLTPSGAPFFAGTYYPPAPRPGMPSFPQVLAAMADVWAARRHEVLGQAERLRAALAAPAELAAPAAAGIAGAASLAALEEQAIDHLEAQFDPHHGGFGPAPKFPPASQLELLLRLGQGGGQQRAWAMVEGTLHGMARGGMYDLLAGGFSRYSTDGAWRVPHFEKMLYDNALLARLYARAHALCPQAGYGAVAAATLDWLLAEMALPSGALAASLDADDPHGEGAAYAWTPAQVRDALAGVPGAADWKVVCRHLGVTDAGTWEQGRSLPRRGLDAAALADEGGEEGLAAALAVARAALLAARRRRPAPPRDDKQVVGHNGLAMSGLAAGARALGRPDLLAAGGRAAEAVWRTAWRGDGQLARLAGPGAARAAPGILEDYAYLGEGLLALYEAGGPLSGLQRAAALAEAIAARFVDACSGALCETASDRPALLYRPIEMHDGATPAAAATACALLARLAQHLDRPAWAALAGRALQAHAAAIARAPQAHCRALLALRALATPPETWAVVRPDGAGEEAWADPLVARATAVMWPDRLVAHGFADGPPALLRGLRAQGGRSTLYACGPGGCAPPRHEV